MKKGNSVWLVDHTRSNPSGSSQAIATIGPKWITLSGDYGRRFHRDTLTSEHHSARIYATKAEYELILEYERLVQSCRQKFSYGGLNKENLTIAQLRQIDAILQEAKP